MKNLVFLFSFCVIVSSCEKESRTQTTVRGVVKERNGNRILAGAKVFLVKFESTTYTLRTIKMDSSISNSQGEFSFNFDYGEGDFRVEAEYPHYFNLIRHTSKSARNLLTLGKSQVSNVELWPVATAKIRFINTSGNYIGVNVNPVYSGFGWQIREPDATIFTSLRGNIEEDIDYFPKPGGVHHEKIIYPTGNDTLNLEIEY